MNKINIMDNLFFVEPKLDGSETDIKVPLTDITKIALGQPVVSDAGTIYVIVNIVIKVYSVSQMMLVTVYVKPV